MAAMAAGSGAEDGWRMEIYWATNLFLIMLRRLSLGVAAAAALLLLLQPRIAHARNPSPFSSNVVALTARNWKREVEDSPHGVFVNICRSG